MSVIFLRTSPPFCFRFTKHRSRSRVSVHSDGGPGFTLPPYAMAFARCYLSRSAPSTEDGPPDSRERADSASTTRLDVRRVTSPRTILQVARVFTERTQQRRDGAGPPRTPQLASSLALRHFAPPGPASLLAGTRAPRRDWRRPRVRAAARTARRPVSAIRTTQQSRRAGAAASRCRAARRRQRHPPGRDPASGRSAASGGDPAPDRSQTRRPSGSGVSRLQLTHGRRATHRRRPADRRRAALRAAARRDRRPVPAVRLSPAPRDRPC